MVDETENIKPDEIWPQPILEITHTPTIGKLVLALAHAQLNYKPVLKQTDNAAFMRAGKASKYADLATYIDATQEALAKEELVVMQWPDVSPEAKSMTLVSILAHSSGEWIRGRITLPALGRTGFDAQSCGSSITYARRYSYAAITGCASEDDDGNAASGRGSHEAAQDVAREKLEKEAKKGNPIAVAGLAAMDKQANYVPSLFYTPTPAGLYEISGDGALKKAQQDLLKPYWNAVARAILVGDAALEDLKFQFEQRGVPFSVLKAA